MPNIHPGKRFRLLREAQFPHVSQAKAATLLGTTRNIVANWEAEPPRGTPSMEELTTAGSAWGAPSTAWFFEEGPSLTQADVSALVRKNLFMIAEPEHKIPLWRNIPCGPTDEAWLDETVEWIEVPAFLYRTSRVATSVMGNSMEPRLRQGDLLIFEKDPMPRAGRIILASDGEGGATVKSVKRESTGWELHALNAKSAPIKASNIFVIGYLVAILRDWTTGRGTIEWDDGGIVP